MQGGYAAGPGIRRFGPGGHSKRPLKHSSRQLEYREWTESICQSLQFQNHGPTRSCRPSRPLPYFQPAIPIRLRSSWTLLVQLKPNHSGYRKTVLNTLQEEPASPDLRLQSIKQTRRTIQAPVRSFVTALLRAGDIFLFSRSRN